MKISVELSSLQASLDIITRLAPPTSGNITVTSDGKKVQLTSSADTSRCITTVPCSVDRAGEYAVPLAALRDATKGRGELTLTYKNAVLNVNSGRYSASLVTVDVIPLDDYEAEEGQIWKLMPDQSAWLRKALRDVALKPTLILSSWMPVGIKLTPKGGFVTCYDMQHMGWVSDKTVAGDFECVLPLETMTNVIDLFHKTQFSIRHCSSRIEIKNKLTQVFLSIPSLEDLPSLADVQSKIKSASAEKGKTFVIPRESLTAFMENARAVMTKERAEIRIEGADKGIKVEIKTGQGNVNTQFKGEGKGSFKIDYEYLSEALTKTTDDLTLTAVDNAYVSAKFANMNMIIALNQ